MGSTGGIGCGAWVAAVEDGVEVGVVVHLELAVELEAAAAALDLGPQVEEAAEEIVVLLLEEGEAVAVAGAMRVAGGGPGNLFGGVETFEGEDGEAVEHGAGGLGVERGGWGLGAGCVEEVLVDLLDEVVAALVEGVDGVLDVGDVAVRGGGVAGAVFLVPEVEVGAVVGFGEGLEGGGRCGVWSGVGGVPELCPVELGGGEVFEGLMDFDAGGCGHESHCSSWGREVH